MPPRPAPLHGLLREILRDPERDHCPRARPVVSVHASDPPDYAALVRARARRTVRLRRRGVDHGLWAEFRPDGLVAPLSGRKRRLVALRMRWHAARPIFLPSSADPAAFRARECEELYVRLGSPGGLADWLEGRGLEPVFRVTGPRPPADPERDLETLGLAGPGAGDLWIKSGRLSLHPGDASLRLRVSFGREGPDDGSSDPTRLELVRALAQLALPCGGLLERDSLLTSEPSEIAGRPFSATQPILYWNAPNGGALFHHDAFSGPPESQQAGVLYAQLTGATAWLALSITDLAQRVREVLALISEGDMPWLEDELPNELARARALAGTWSRLVSELAEPGLGVLGPLVGRPEMTGYLADSGHALVLQPGEGILLPNFGLERTALHSVFCASPGIATGLSVALWERRP